MRVNRTERLKTGGGGVRWPKQPSLPSPPPLGCQQRGLRGRQGKHAAHHVEKKPPSALGEGGGRAAGRVGRGRRRRKGWRSERGTDTSDMTGIYMVNHTSSIFLYWPSVCLLRWEGGGVNTHKHTVQDTHMLSTNFMLFGWKPAKMELISVGGLKV